MVLGVALTNARRSFHRSEFIAGQEDTRNAGYFTVFSQTHCLESLYRKDHHWVFNLLPVARIEGAR